MCACAHASVLACVSVCARVWRFIHSGHLPSHFKFNKLIVWSKTSNYRQNHDQRQATRIGPKLSVTSAILTSEHEKELMQKYKIILKLKRKINSILK
jgi:hypothetical protein